MKRVASWLLAGCVGTHGSKEIFSESYERNWIQTIPGKGWFAILRLYGPLDAWFDKTWRPGEIGPFDSIVQ